MFQRKLKNVQSVFTTVLALIAITTSLPGQNRNRRANPSTLRPEEPSEQISLEESTFQHLYQEAADMRSATLDTIRSMRFTTFEEQHLSRCSFFDVPDVNEDRINQLNYEPFTALRSYSTLITTMYFHIRRCHSNGRIGQQSILNSQTLRHNLERVSGNLYNMNISLNNALQQQISTVQVDLTDYSPLFLALEGNDLSEIYRSFIILKDNYNLMTYLMQLYHAVL